MKQKILQQFDVPEMLLEQLNQRYDIYRYDSLTPEEFTALAPEFRVALSSGEATVTREFFRSLPNLTLLAVFGVGYDGVDALAARELGVKVTHTPDVLTDDVADLAMGLMISASRQIPGAQRFIERGGWQNNLYPWTRRVSGSRLGIFGLGRIGHAIAKRAAAFDMHIAYTDRQRQEGVPFTWHDSLAKLAADSDYLVVCTPGGAGNRHLVDRGVMDALGAEGILINISRGSVVDEQALIQALEAGTLGGAALDVYENEPHVSGGLLERDNVVLTPHMGSATWSTRRAMTQLVVDNVDACFAGRPLPTPVPECR